MKKPKISVLIPTYNRREYLREALSSVVCQSVKPYEVIVADDNINPAESQKNEEVVKEFSKKYDFVIYHKNKTNLGPSGNYKSLFYIASGDIIQFLGDDDILSPLALELLSKPLIENKEIKLSGGRTFFSDTNLNIYSSDNLYSHNMFLASELFKDNVLEGKEIIKYCYASGLKNIFGSFSGFMFRKKDVDFQLFNFNGTEIIANSDMFLWMSLLRKGRAFLSKHFLNIFRIHGQNDQFKVEKRALEEILLFHHKDFLEYLEMEYDYISPRFIQIVTYRYIVYDNLPNKNSPYVKYFIENSNIKGQLEDSFLVLTGNDKNFMDRIINSNAQYIAFVSEGFSPLNNNWKEISAEKFKENQDVVAISGISNAEVLNADLLSYVYPNILSYLSLEEVSNLISNSYYDKAYSSNVVSKACWITKRDVFLEFYNTLDQDINHQDLWFHYSIFLKEKKYKHLVVPSILFYNPSIQKFVLESSDKIIKNLIKTYGYGNVPEPYEYFFEEKRQTDYLFLPVLSNGKYRFVFNFSGKTKDKKFFREKAVLIKSYPKVCVITVNYKTYDEVKKLAKSIAENRYKNIDFVVVDNSEDDSSFDKFVKDLKEIFLDSGKKFYAIKNQNTGYAGGNNIGINFCLENLKPTYIWILNPDTVINDNTPIELIKTVEYADVPVVTCKMIDSLSGLCQYNGKNVSYVGGLPESFGVFRTPFLTGANIFMKSEFIDKIGFFDEKFFLYFEDNEYKQRMEKMDIYPLYTPFCNIFHKGAVSTEGYLKTPLSVYYYVRNLLYFGTQNVDPKIKHMVVDNILTHEVEKIYTQNIRKKDVLISVILGIYDYLKSVYGKVDLKERYNTVLGTIEDTPFLEWNLNRKLEIMFKHMLKEPRDIASLKKIINLIRDFSLAKIL